MESGDTDRGAPLVALGLNNNAIQVVDVRVMQVGQLLGVKKHPAAHTDNLDSSTMQVTAKGGLQGLPKLCEAYWSGCSLKIEIHITGLDCGEQFLGIAGHDLCPSSTYLIGDWPVGLRLTRNSAGMGSMFSTTRGAFTTRSQPAA